MSISPKYSSHVIGKGPIVIDLYLDYVCPYSKKLYRTVYQQVLPKVQEKYSDKVQFIFRHQIQPWHPSSTLVHEAGIAVAQLAPSKFWEFSYALFEELDSYNDESAYNLSRHEIYVKLAELAEKSVGVDKNKFLELLTIAKDAKNSGNKVQADVKYFIKFGRQNGIHVSPSVTINGILDNSISSSFTGEQWFEKFTSVIQEAGLQ
jgi:protein-disulfide isomerase